MPGDCRLLSNGGDAGIGMYGGGCESCYRAAADPTGRCKSLNFFLTLPSSEGLSLCHLALVSPPLGILE